jgi:hypothetical protein
MTPHDQDASAPSFVRGFMLTAVTMFAPILLAIVGLSVVPNHALGGAVMWGWLLLPYWTDPAVVPPGVGLLLAAVHWVLVAAVVGVVTRRLRLLLAFGFAVVVVVATGGTVMLVLSALGYRYTFEGL